MIEVPPGVISWLTETGRISTTRAPAAFDEDNPGRYRIILQGQDNEASHPERGHETPANPPTAQAKIRGLMRATSR